MGDYAWSFTASAALFLREAKELLASDPVVSTVVATAARRDLARRTDPGEQPFPYWFALCRDARGSVVSAAMRTAPFAPHPLWVLPMPFEAARSLAAAMVDRHEAGPGDLLGVNGALPAAQLCAGELAEGVRGHVRTHQQTRLFRLDVVVWPEQPLGTLRRAGEEDLDLVVEWVGKFGAEQMRQAGREPDLNVEAGMDATEAAKRLAAGAFWLFEDVIGERVHLCAVTMPAYGVARIGPVFTPEEHRGRGYAGWSVATLSQRLLDIGVTPCLFTDQFNPIATSVYERIGFKAVADTVQLLVQ